ncbi:hypothetical protein C8R43DRAFT_1115929 [Mycena crocata]|nr:hypothetical protein C8R43DRAFT_1115929 [Mycena crocata]
MTVVEKRVVEQVSLSEETLVPAEQVVPPTQTFKLLQDLRRMEPALQDQILAHEAHPLFGTPCRCGWVGHVCEVICHWCTQYEPSCQNCFVQSHRNNPLHWAEVWNTEKGFLVRHDISRLKYVPVRPTRAREGETVEGVEVQTREELEQAYAIPFGHYGYPCTFGNGRNMSFTIVDITGIHATSVNFCRHAVGVDKIAQLLKARMFPCTFDDAKSAVTFECLKAFQMFSLEGKIAGYDYAGSLARLTDNSFTEDVPNLYENLLRTSRMWGSLTMKKRAGQEHKIDAVLFHRPEGNLIPYCPCCPEAGLNTDVKMGKLPKELRHLNQERMTLDGNFHANKTMKNTDPADTSLYDGKAYFPTDAFLKKQIARAPKTEPKSTCNYLKAVNNQNKKKFKNMEITGIVNAQCSHVFVKASVDLQFGERYVNVDTCLAHALRQKLGDGHRGEFTFELEVELGKIDHVLSYDAMCQYSVKIVDRFEKNPDFKDLVPLIERTRFCIPALHVQGHQEGCMYAYSSAYMLATTHFHGETAEHYWPELNQLSSKTRQMNGGHRQDVIMHHHSDWNYKKMAKAVALLIADLVTAEELFALHWNQYLGLTAANAQRLVTENWRGESREANATDMKNVISVYRQRKSKVPTQNALYQKVLEDESAIPGSETKRNKAAAFVNEGLKIQESQLKLKVAVAANIERSLLSTRKEITTGRANLENCIAKFRKSQELLCPALSDYLAPREPGQVECELLGLPSEFKDVKQRVELGLVALGSVEEQLREGAAFDAIHSIQVVAKALVSMTDRRRKNDSGIYKNTISQKQINDTEERRDGHIKKYMAARAALMDLGATTGEMGDFPVMTVEDTWCKSKALKRGLGDSRKLDGLVWTMGSSQVGARVPRLPQGDVNSTSAVLAPVEGGTKMMRRKIASRSQTKAKMKPRKTEESKKRRSDGWIWTFGRMGKMDAAEVDAWTKEGDRVQWFRAEAEMERWREQMEAKLAELRTTFRTFAVLQKAWTTMATLQDKSNAGHIAYALQKAWMFGERERRGREALRNMPKYAPLAEDDADLVEFVLKERASHDAMVLDVLGAQGFLATDNEWVDIEEEDSDEEDSDEEDGDEEHAQGG